MLATTTLSYRGPIPTIYTGPNTPSLYTQLQHAFLTVLPGAYPPDMGNKGGLQLHGIDSYGTCTWAPQVAYGEEQKRFPFFRWVDLKIREDQLQRKGMVLKTEDGFRPGEEIVVKTEDGVSQGGGVVLKTEDGVPDVEPKIERESGMQTVKKIKVHKEESPPHYQTRYELRSHTRYDLRPRGKKV